MGSVYSSSVVAIDGQQNAIPNRSKRFLLTHPRVETDKGMVEGFRHQLVDGRPINVFLGIPFAKPPIGELRFKKPVELDGWHPEILTAKKYRQRSIQMNFLHTDIDERRAGKSEDCLYLNVIAPGWKKNERESQAGFPVMFYIHGGAYLIDSAVKYNHKRLARTLVHLGVIVVVIQYRLGLLGFFSTGDQQCPGNFGLWDQLMALQWTKTNIAAFGGDPTRITVFGQSAGAVSADLLGICPLSRDLFAQSILMGGNAECSWALLDKRQIVQYCRKWAMKMGFKAQMTVDGNWPVDENRRMVEFLKKLPAAKFEINLIGAIGEMFEKIRLPIGPVIDSELIPKSPKELRMECQQMSKRTIVGICKNEGMLFLALAMKRANAKLLAKFEKQLEELLERASKKSGNTNIQSIQRNSTLLSKFYGINEAMQKNKQIIEKTCVTLLSDFVNNIGLHNFCHHSQANNNDESGWTIFRYQFDHFNPNNTRALNPLMPLKGSTHSTELAFIFDVNMFVLPWSRTNADKKVLSMVTKMWTNFAKFGDPNGQNENFSFHWDQITPENIGSHLRISADEPKMHEESSATGNGNDGKRIEMLAAVYRALIQ